MRNPLLQYGRSSAEYALLLGLMALVATPALGLLSNSIGASLTQGARAASHDDLLNLLTPTTTPGVRYAEALSELKAHGGTLEMALQGSDLTLRLNGLPLGNSQDATGAQGALMTRVMADQLLALADQLEQAGGDPALSARLRALAGVGHQLAQVEDTVNQAALAHDTAALTVNDPSDPHTLASQMVTAHWQWTDQANDLMAWMKTTYPTQVGNNSQFQSALLQETFDRLNVYVEGIDTVGANTFVNASGVFRTPAGDSTASLASLLGKTAANANTSVQGQIDTSGITMDIAPTFTHVTSQRIASAEQAARSGVVGVGGYVGTSLPN